MFDKMENNPSELRLIYKNIDGIGLPMHIYLPKESKKHSNIAVVCIHGGGRDVMRDNSAWDGGWMSWHAKYFAKRGFVGIARKIVRERRIYCHMRSLQQQA